MHWEISMGRLPTPEIKLGRRLYYRADELEALEERWRSKKATHDS
jgi:hypothetical protein